MVSGACSLRHKDTFFFFFFLIFLCLKSVQYGIDMAMVPDHKVIHVCDELPGAQIDSS